MRLDKFLSTNTELSRSQIKRLAKNGAISVNGQAALDTATHLVAEDAVAIDGRPVVQRQPLYLMLHKPGGYVCSHESADHPRVLDLLIDLPVHSPPAHELQMVGRLDVDTTGLLLITSDGLWNHQLTAPRKGLTKTYQVQLADDFDPATQDAFAEGIALKGETKPTLPAQITPVKPREVLVTVCEGKYHQVKRMFAATGNRVIHLHRVSIGPLVLDSRLAPGQYRPLEVMELEALAQVTRSRR